MPSAVIVMVVYVLFTNGHHPTPLSPLFDIKYCKYIDLPATCIIFINI
jgi:hypothetical protein